MADRTDISFSSGGEQIAAWLYRPATAAGDTPVVVMAHGFGGIREQRLDAYAERFGDAGIAALVFDYRHFGASSGEPRQLLDIGRQLEDWRAAITFARSLDGVDGGRLAIWGTSFSGGHVATLAAGDPSVRAAISQAPFMDGLRNLPALGVIHTLRLTAHGIFDVVRTRLGRTPHRIPIVAAPGKVGVMTTPDAEPGFRALIPPGVEWQDTVAARIALRIGTYRPGRKAGMIACPWLVVICEDDAVTPPGYAAEAVEAAPQGEAISYPGAGHFEIYVGELFERTIVDQTAFLRRNLGLAA